METTKVESAPTGTKSMESVPLISHAKPGKVTAPTQSKRHHKVKEDRSKSADESVSLPDTTAEPLKTQVPVRAEATSQLTTPSEKSAHETQEVQVDIRHAQTVEEHQGVLPEPALKRGETGPSTLKPVQISPDVEATSTESKTSLQWNLTHRLEVERSVCGTKQEGDIQAALSKVPQSTSTVIEMEKTKVPTLTLSHPDKDTERHEHASLATVEESQGVIPEAALRRAETEPSTIKPVQVSPDVVSTSTGTEMNIQLNLIHHLEDETSVCKPKVEKDMQAALSKAPQATSPVIEMEKTKVPTLPLSHPDTDTVRQEHASLATVEEPQGVIPDAAVIRGETGPSTVKPVEVSPDVEATSTGTETNLQLNLIHHLKEEPSICKPKEEKHMQTSLSKAPQATSTVIEMEKTKVESAPTGTKSMESVPLKSHAKPGKVTAPTQSKRRHKVKEDRSKSADESVSLPDTTAQPLKTQVPVRVEPTSQLTTPSETSAHQTQEVQVDIRHAPTVEDPQGVIPGAGLRQGETGPSTVKPVQISEMEKTKVPTLSLSHPYPDTDRQEHSALVVQSELQEQRDLIEAICRYSNSPEMVLAKQSPSGMRAGCSGMSPIVHESPATKATTSEIWTQLLSRLQTLLDSVSAEQDRAPSEVRGFPEDKVKINAGSRLMLELRGYTEQLRRLCHNAGSMDTQAAVEVRGAALSELYETLSGLSQTLTSITHTLSESSREASPLQLLILPGLSAQLTSVETEINSLASGLASLPSPEMSESSACLQRLRSYVLSVQRTMACQENLQSVEHLLESPVSMLEARVAQQSDPHHLVQDPHSEQSAWGGGWSSLRGLRETVEEGPALHGSSQALLQGLEALVELGSERLQRTQSTRPISCHQLQNLLSQHKRYFQEVKKCHAMTVHLSNQLPEGAPQGQEDAERLVSDVLLQAQEQGARMQYNIQEWSQYEEMRGALSRQLEELDAALPSEDLYSDMDQHPEERLHTYQQVQRLLEDCRPQLEMLRDWASTLQEPPCLAWDAAPRAGLQAYWQCLHRRLEKHIQHTEEMRLKHERFQCSSAELEEWMATARARVQMLTSPAPMQDARALLPQLRKLIGELESRSVQVATAVKAGTNLLHLTDSGNLALGQQLAQLEQSWTELTNTLPSLQCTMQQLLSGLAQTEVIAELISWLKHMEARLEEENSGEQYVLGSAGLAVLLQRAKDAKAEETSWQPCLDFLNQSIEQVSSQDDPSKRNERLLCAEQLGGLNLRWTLLQEKTESQMHKIEYRKQACADREGHLHQICSWMSKLGEKMRVSERPAGWTQIQQVLEDCKREEEMLEQKSAELLQLETIYLLEQKDGQHAGDQTFSTQLESTILQSQALRQQLCTVQASLAMLKEQWTQWDMALRNAALGTASMAYRLQCKKGPLFSLQQRRDHVKQLQDLQTEMTKSAETWTSLARLWSDLSGRIHPGTARLLSTRLDGERARWTATVKDVDTQLQKAQMELQLGQEYKRLYRGCSGSLRSHWGQYEELLRWPAGQQEDRVDLLHSRISAISLLENKMEEFQSSAGEVCEASKLLIAQMEPQAAPMIQSETRLLSRDLVHLSQALARRRQHLQEDLEEYVTFSRDLKSLEQHFKSFEGPLSSPTTNMECLKMGLLELSTLTPELGALNEQTLRLVVGEHEAERLQTLNTQWTWLFSQAANRHREMYSEQLCAQSFQQQCQAWMALLEKMEVGLCNSISGDGFFIREQLAAHQKLKLEVLGGQQLLDAVISGALRLLERGSAEDEGYLVLRLTQLRERWLGTLHTVQQRSRCLEQLAQQWRIYTMGMKRLWRLLGDLEPLLPPAGLALCSLQQLQQSIQDYERAQKQLDSYEQLYTQTLRAGRLVFSQASTQARLELVTELRTLQEAWEQSCSLLEKRKALTETVIHKWSSCEIGLADSMLRLKEVSDRLKEPLPDNLELQENLFKEDEDSLVLWAKGLRDLATMKADVSQYVLPRDAALLQARLEELHSQWEEVCLKVSKRKQEIADRLNAWIIFNDKNKELCDWLDHMEHKVAHSDEHLSSEEVVEKLKKDCMEEINLFSDNKRHLKQLGEQLLLVSDQVKEAQIHGALCHIDQRWQHLFDHIEARVNKLKETLVTVQQLHKNMSKLQPWLSRVETELAKPVHYSVCQGDEIQRKLAEQQELQRDIEQHTEGVSSILMLCDVLLRDEDACSSDSENDSIQATTHNLDQRWRKICSMSLERRTRIEETWRLWCRFQDDYSHFEDWLNAAERSASEPSSSDVLYTVAKEELRRYEALQREVHEKLTQLENINHQYCQLARENRLDAGSRLRAMVHQGNQQWDALQKRVAAILRRLRHFTAQREEFEGTRSRLLLWLTEMDLQLSTVEHLSESDVHHKLEQLSGLKKEITLNTNQIDALIVFGEGLIQRSSPLDAALIEDELEELHSYCQEVFSRATRFHQRLTSPRPLLQEEAELCGGEDTGRPEVSELAKPNQDSSSQAPTCLLAPPMEHSGRETPVSVDSIPLEWDHTGDVGGSSSHEEDEDASFFSGASGVEVTESTEAFVESTVQSLAAASGDGLVVSPHWHSQTSAERKTLSSDFTGPHLAAHSSTPCKQGYVQLLSECSGSIKRVKRVSLLLDEEERLEDQGLTALTAADKQSGVIERWELLQARAVSHGHSHPRQQLTSDLNDITSWLGRVSPELEGLLSAEMPVTLKIMEDKVSRLKELQKDFARYKTLMLSLNLGGRELQREADVQGYQLPGDLCGMNQAWGAASASLGAWETRLRRSLLQCQEFHETLHSLLLWLAHAESRRYTVNIHEADVLPSALHKHRTVLTGLEEELEGRQRQVGSLQELAYELLPESGPEESSEAREKVHVIGGKLRLLLHQVKQDLQTIQERLESSGEVAESSEIGASSVEPAAEAGAESRNTDSVRVVGREAPPRRSFFYRVLRAAFPLHLLLLLLLVLACLVPLSEEDYSCTLVNNFARSFYPMLRYTNGPPPT